MRLELIPDRLRDALRRLAQSLPEYADEVVRTAQIPAPTFAEAERARYIGERFRAAGAEDVHIDPVGNVIGRLGNGRTGPGILLAAHMDTVFPANTDCAVRRQGQVLIGPGVGDNASNLVGMLFVMRALRESGVELQRPLLFAATVGEEGLGDLRGIKAIMERHRHEIGVVLAIDGGLGGLIHQGVGSRRLRVTVRTGGGHSWSGFGAPSAVHAIGRMIARISGLDVPREPRTTFNVGVVSGGVSVNTIAPEAEMLIDLRSVERAALLRLEERVREVLESEGRDAPAEVAVEVIGDRPTGSIPFDHPLCRIVRDVHRSLGVHTYSAPSSTDANVPLALGVPAVTIGVTTGGNGHRIDEFIHLQPAVTGMQQIALVIAELQEPSRFDEVAAAPAAR